MALLKFAAEAIEKTKAPAEGWYLVDFENVKDEMSKPKEGKTQSLNCFADVRLLKSHNGEDVSHLDKKKEKKFLFNYEYWHMNAEFLLAMLDIPTLDMLKDKEIDMSAEVERAKMWAYVKHGISDKGKEYWDFDKWHPASSVPF